MKRRKFLATTTGAICASSTISNLTMEPSAAITFNTNNTRFSEADVITNDLIVSFSDITITTENIQNIQEDLRFEVQIYTDIIGNYKTIDTAKLNIDSGSTTIDVGSLSYNLSNYSLNIKDSGIVRALIKLNHPDITTNSNQVILVEPSDNIFREYWSNGLTDWNTTGSVRSSGGSFSHDIVSDAVTGKQSCRIYADANCYSSPYDGSYAEVNRDIELPTGDYEIEYWSKVKDYGYYDYPSTDTANEGRIYLDNERIAIITDMCSDYCSTDWINNKQTFTVSSGGSHKLSLRFSASDCIEGYVYWDDIRIRSLS